MFLRRLLLLALFVPGLVFAQDDRWESLNRDVHGFNDLADKYVLRPTAKAYDRFVPRFIRRGIGNIFENIGTPATAINQLLQGKPKKSLSDTGRFLLNTTVGIGGIFDPATPAGLDKHEEDFGQTFGVWGAQSGHFVVLPFLGPSTVRDGIGLVFDGLLNPIRFIKPSETRAAVTALYVIDLRASLLGVDELVQGDRYLFLRDAYLQRRSFLINDGVADEDPFADDGFEFDE